MRTWHANREQPRAKYLESSYIPVVVLVWQVNLVQLAEKKGLSCGGREETY